MEDIKQMMPEETEGKKLDVNDLIEKGKKKGSRTARDIDEAIEALAEAAFNANYSTARYITAMYGSGVKEKGASKS